MLKTDKIIPGDGVVCIANSGAGARFALGLLVIVVLLLSH